MPVDPETAELAGKANPRLELESSPVRLPFFFFSAMLYDMWDLSSLIKDQTHVPCVDRTEFQPLDHWGSPDTRAEGPQALPSQLAGTRRGSGS